MPLDLPTRPNSLPAESVIGGPRRRLKLWEIETGYHCSIVGTCLSPGMVRQMVRRARVEVEPGMEEYRVHSLLVSEAMRPGVIGRLLGKALDETYAGIVRRVGAASGEAELGGLWDELCAKGEVAAGYWAFMSHAHVPSALRVRVFGEVHMLSHFMGGHNRGNAKALWMAERRAEQLAERLARSRRQARETAAERDRRIVELEVELACTRDELAARVAQVVHGRRAAERRRVVARRGLERRVLAARARLRRAEEDNQRLRRLLDALADDAAPQGGAAPAAPSSPLPSPADRCTERCLLYVGGRCSLVPHLRRHAEARRLRLLHHDGGEEESLHALEGLVGRADAVFCPVDCVSHRACLAAKQLCRRLAKPFVPLRTGSGNCFLQAVDRWRGAAADARPSA
jgi:hypothetical protein